MKSAWEETIKLNDKDVVFKLDTGPEVTVISDEVFSGLGKSDINTIPWDLAET